MAKDKSNRKRQPAPAVPPKVAPTPKRAPPKTAPTGALEQLTVAALRRLAREQVGEGYSKLRTKAQLIEALVRRTVSSVAGDLKRTASNARRTETARRGPPPTAAAKKAVAAGSSKARASVPESMAPVVLKKKAAEVERSGSLVALPVDAQTLFVRWAWAPQVDAGERVVLEVSSAGGQVVHSEDIPAATRQLYVHGLPRTGTFRSALVAVGAGGQRRPLGLASRPVVLLRPAVRPAKGERFVQFSWAHPAASAVGAAVPAPGRALTTHSAASPDQAAAAAQQSAERAAGSAATSPRGSRHGFGAGEGTRPTSFRG